LKTIKENLPDIIEKVKLSGQKAIESMVPVALRAAGMPSCQVPGRLFGSSALSASGIKRSTGKFPRITSDLAAIIR